MIDTKFTPGPWVIDSWDGDTPDALKECTLIQTRSEHIKFGLDVAYAARIRDSNYNTTEQDANAALIAAAPDLYAALDALLDDYLCARAGWNDEEIRTSDRLVSMARYALAKARGES